MESDPRYPSGRGDRQSKPSVPGASTADDPPDTGIGPAALGERPLENRLWLVVAGILLVTMPALTLLLLFVILSVTRSALLDELTLLEVAEIYLVEFVMFAVFSYLLYRLLRYSLAREGSFVGSGTEEDEESRR
ncbi:hypothetical protein [Haloarchaeobius amylolyticus]|uniref:hypothetical protein n=1 Tax=Haloarchaeobius amylolyticus TaxID=1198296 RepID=UPI00227208A4|nr:hypothetical protein [Haloarchaeobius amylolyticus]